MSTLIPARCALALALAVVWTPGAASADGVVEISQACAAAGCMPGDGAGFPVSLGESGSYRLTSNLVVPDENTSAIVLGPDADFSSIDLNGFAIMGPTVCIPLTGCSPVGTGSGIVADNLTSNVRVRNGTIVGMGDHGIFLQNRDHVQAVTAQSNGGVGIEVGSSSSVIDCQALLNGGPGIRVDENESSGLFGNAGRSLLSGNLAVGNLHYFSTTRYDMEGGGRTGGNRCSDGSCSTRGLRRYLQTHDPVAGSNAAAECPGGFHVASVWELISPSSLQYDVVRGVTISPSGASGPPTVFEGWAWVDDGATCLGFDDPGGSGRTIRLSYDPASQDVGPWDVGPIVDCDTALARVWCIED